MPTAQDIKIIFKEVLVTDDSDPFGSGEFRFIAEVDGKSVGQPKQVFDAVEGKTIVLPAAHWTSQTVDVRGRSDVKMSFRGIDEDWFFDDELGSVSHTFRPPWKQGVYRQKTKYFILTYEIVLGVRTAAAQMTYAGTIAHEVCHLLNLNHRVENPIHPAFDDGVRYPPNENVMHWNNPTSLAQDFDIIQAKAVRQSPMVPP